MADGASSSSAAKGTDAAGSVSVVETLFQRRIEFHPARKQASSFPVSDGGFRLESLNPNSGPVRHVASSGGAVTAAASQGNHLGEAEFYEHGLDPELSCRITFRRIGAGLANLGNTCFLNSVLQCLTYTEPFAAYLQSGKHKSSCHTAGFCAICALQNHVITALQSSGKILSPAHLVKNLRCVSRTFRNSRQEDAHEYMVNLLESMHKSCLPSGVPSESPGAYEKSLVHKIFGGRLRSEVKCTQCSYSSCKFDPFLDLSLEIVKADSLRKALAYFTAVEQLDGGQKQYQCQRCKEKVRALKQLTIHKAPYVLTIHLKRFGSHIAGQKIDKKVEFEPTLDLKPFVSDEHAVNLKYTLYGVLVHAGWSTHSGHYYCYVRTSSGMWHSLDDIKVSQVSETTVLAQKAYMLFYVRNRNPMPKGSVNKPGKDNIFANTTGKKLVPESYLISNGVTKNNLIEKNSSTSEAVSAKWGTNSANLQPTSAMDTSAHSPVPQAISTLQNCNTARNEIPELQNNSQVIGRESFVLQEDRDSLPKGPHQTNSSLTLSQGPMNSPVGNGNYYGKSSNISASRSDEVKSGAFIAQPNDTACDVFKSRKQEHKLRNESDKAKNCDAVMTAQKNDELCETVKCIPEDDRKVTLSNQSIQMDEFIRKDGKAPLGNVTTNQNVRCSSNLQSQENSLPHEEKHLLKKLGSRSSFQKEACVDDTIHKPLKVKPKKFTKLPRRRLLLGRNHLFLTSLGLHMIKKSKKCNTRHVSLAVLHEDFSISKDDQGASTSEPSKIAAVFKHSCTKRSRCELNKEKIAQTMKNPNYCNGESSNATDVEGMDNGNNIILGELSKTCSISAKTSPYSRTRDAGDNIVSQHNFMNLLMRGLKGTTVARWNDQQPAQLGLNGSESSTGPSIGYLLDEWDEEYDRGKRKKLRKSQSVFGEKNPFQETANRKTRQKSTSMPESMRGGNQPFRI